RRCNRVGVWHLLSCAADAPQSKRASEREPGPENFDRVEGEFRIEAALNVAGLPEAMLLARKQEIADRIAFAPQRLNHTFCLVRRHDGVLFPLEEDHRLREPIRVIERRALAIARFLLRIWSDQPVEVARLKLVGVARGAGGPPPPENSGPRLEKSRGRSAPPRSCSRRRCRR